MKLIKGADVAAVIRERVVGQVNAIKQAGERPPKLAIIRVGEKPGDLSYERNAIKRMEQMGVSYASYHYPIDVEKEEFFAEFDRINQDPEVDGVLVLRPLPPHLECAGVELRIDPERDVDGISPINQSRIMMDSQGGFAPCAPEAVLEILAYAGVELPGKRVTVVGCGRVVGKPLSVLLMSRQATVTICDNKTVDLVRACREAEILISAAGKARLIGPDHVGDGAVIIDVGINVDENGHLCGDVDLEAVMAEGRASLATPVPGGVGVVTTAVLAEHVLQARMRKMK